jgi:tripartite-type tricarboxylate transporter receptor subunit TctC
MITTLTRRAALALCTAAALALPAGAQGWQPQKPVELVIMAGSSSRSSRRKT